MPKYNFHGEVVERWKKVGCPKWDYEATKKICLEVNHYFAEMRQNPTPRFREEVKKKNEKYIKQWVLGCHFDWLNPRQSESIKNKKGK